MRALLQTLLLCLIVNQLHAQCQEQDYTALRALYLNTAGDNWTNNTNWPNSAFFEINPTMPAGTDVNTWYGVQTNVDGCVISLILQSNNLNGSIPPDLDNLSNLNYLWLQGNQLSGNIPLELCDLSSLVGLGLSGNQLIGNIPVEIGNLSNLTELYLDGNQLSGNVPAQLGNLSKLTHLYLFYNQFSGNIPPELGNLSNVTHLSLAVNQFSGTIPPEIGNLSNLERLWLYNNQLDGCYDGNLISLCNQLPPDYNTNAYISDGNNFDTPWENFCNTGAGTCLAATEDVLPGDGNADGIVNTQDALYWGLAEGFNGAPRSNTTIDCSLQSCTDWPQSVDGINSKHQDSDGNGTIDGQDLQIVISNFGCVSDYIAPNYASGVENGSGAAAVAHGLAFTVTSDVIPISRIAMSTTGSSLHPDIEFAILDGNQCHAALTRTDNFDITCGGPIATLLIETNDVPIDIPFEINVTSGVKIKADATLDNITGATAFGMYSGTGANSSNLILDASVTHEQCNGLGGAIAIPSGGTSPYTYAWSTGASTVQVNNLTSGIYTVTVTDDNGLNQSLSLQINGQSPIYDANGNLLCGNLCPEYLAPNGITGSGLYSANNTLNSDATIPPDNTTEYKAGQTILLKSGFEVPSNAEFSAEIEDCQ